MIRCNICNAQLHHRESFKDLMHLFINQDHQIGFANYCLNLERFDEGWRPAPEVPVDDLVMDEV